MMLPLPRLAALALLAGLAAPAFAETPLTDGIVADPCAGRVAIPQSVRDYVRAMYDPTRTAPVEKPPKADLDVLQKIKDDQAKRDWADLCRYRADNARVVAAGKPVEIVFMGDSITEGWATAHPDFFTPAMINRGISGQTTPQMLLRFEADVVALRPKLVHFMGGTNDLAGNTGPTDIAAYRNNVMAMVTIAKANRIGMILAAIPPAAAFPWKPQIHPVATLRALNAWLKDYARQEKLVFVDYGAALAEPDGAMKKAYTFDGIHPNAAGYAAIEPLTCDAIARARRR